MGLGQGLWDENGSLMEVFGFGKKEERKTAANKPGLSQLMAIVGAYVGPLAVPVSFLFPLQSILRKADYFSLLVQDVAHFSPCSSIQTKTIKTAKDHHSSMAGP